MNVLGRPKSTTAKKNFGYSYSDCYKRPGGSGNGVRDSLYIHTSKFKPRNFEKESMESLRGFTDQRTSTNSKSNLLSTTGSSFFLNNQTRKRSKDFEKIDPRKRSDSKRIPFHDNHIKLRIEESIPTLTRYLPSRPRTEIPIKNILIGFRSSVGSETQEHIYRVRSDEIDREVEAKEKHLSELVGKIQEVQVNLEEERKIFEAKYDDVKLAISQEQGRFEAEKQRLQASQQAQLVYYESIIESLLNRKKIENLSGRNQTAHNLDTSVLSPVDNKQNPQVDI